MQRIIFVPLLVIVAAAFVPAQTSVPGPRPAETFTGRLDPQLVPDMVHVYQRVYSAVPDIGKIKFAVPLEKDAVVSAGEFIDERVEAGKSVMLLVEPASSAPYLWIDADGNGTYDASEKFKLTPAPDDPDHLEAVIRLPIKNAWYHDFPFYVHYFRGFQNSKLAVTQRLIEQSVFAIAYGHVAVRGRNVLFQYPFEARLPEMTIKDGVFGVDVNGDGRIDTEQFSVESSYAANTEIPFPLGDIFVSTSKIDLATGTLTVRRREKTEYARVDLAVGATMPDFAFTDTDGKLRHLSDFRGKYLMVDFWGVWCGDCRRETPYHLQAYDRFRGRGFEILGIDSDEKIDTLKAYTDKNKMTWTQATFASTRDLANITYRIEEYPSTILLDPNGRVLVLDQHALQGQSLLNTLDRVLPRAVKD